MNNMKKVVSLVLCVVMVMTAMSVMTFSASAATSGNYEYTVYNGHAIIKDFRSDQKTVVIPSTINGYPVTEIGDDAFEDCWHLTSVTIPYGVTSIGVDAFADCSNLGKVVLPSTLKSIGNSAFYYCYLLTSISIPSGVTSIGKHAFYYCHSLTSVSLPSSLKSIGYQAFYGCNKLASISIPSGVTSIDEDAFRGCSGLQKLTVPGGVKNIEKSTFRGCSGLMSVTIGNGVTSIGESAFENCDSMTSITIPGSVKDIDEWAFCSCDYLKEINYGGTAAEWSSIDIDCGNSILEKATINYMKPGTPALTGVSNTADGVRITWKGASKASTYRLYRKTTGGSWARLGDVSSSARSCLDKTAKAGVTYQYTVRAINSYGMSNYNKTGLSIRRLAPTKITSAANGPVNIVLKWNKSAGATGYYVYRKTVNSGWTRIAATKNPTYSDGNRSQGVRYYYSVRAYYGKSISSYSTAVMTFRLQQTKITSLSNSASRKMTVYWGKKSYVSGYQVYYKTGTTPKVATSKNPSGKGLVIGNLKKGATYTVRVRTFKTVNGKNFYSAWGPARTVKIAK